MSQNQDREDIRKRLTAANGLGVDRTLRRQYLLPQVRNPSTAELPLDGDDSMPPSFVAQTRVRRPHPDAHGKNRLALILLSVSPDFLPILVLGQANRKTFDYDRETFDYDRETFDYDAESPAVHYITVEFNKTAYNNEEIFPK
ncbi:hypothetical protein E4U23_007059 [Claviceps purpurea]|nr:hypothetical protein E4U23_007059 [Claviceps purpurea]